MTEQVAGSNPGSIDVRYIHVQRPNTIGFLRGYLDWVHVAWNKNNELPKVFKIQTPEYNHVQVHTVLELMGHRGLDSPRLNLPPNSPYEHHAPHIPTSKHPNQTHFWIGATWPPTSFGTIRTLSNTVRPVERVYSSIKYRIIYRIIRYYTV